MADYYNECLSCGWTGDDDELETDYDEYGEVVGFCPECGSEELENTLAEEREYDIDDI